MMHRCNSTLVVLWCLCLSLSACTPPSDASKSPPSQTASPFRLVLDLHQLMTRVIDPAADGIWDSVQTIVTQKGTRQIQPHTDDEWSALVASAATLLEAANSLMLEGRARDQTEWLQAARRLSTTAEHAMQAALAKDPEEVFTAGGEIYEVCRGCHQRYAPHLNTSPGETSSEPTQPPAKPKS